MLSSPETPGISPETPGETPGIGPETPDFGIRIFRVLIELLGVELGKFGVNL